MNRVLLVLLLCQGAWAAVLLNGTGGRIGKTVFTVEDVRFFDAVLKFREGATQTPELDAEALKAATQKLVFEEMVAAEMRSLQVEPGGRRQAEEQLRAMRAKISDGHWKTLFARYGRNDASVLQILQRGIEVEKFLEKKVETLTPVVTDSEAARYFKQNEAKFYGATFESIKPTVIRLLQKQEMEKGLQEWVRLLRDKHHAMNLIDK